MANTPIQSSVVAAWFFETKLVPPKSNTSLMDRVEALSRVQEASQYTLGLVTAPAGFGKSSLLSQWYQRNIDEGNIVAWVSLDYSDADVRRFASYLVIALDRAGVDMGALRFAAEQSLIELSMDVVSSRIIHALVNARAQIFVALDDYYQAECPEVNEFLTVLLEHAPSNLHFIVSSRSQPDLQIGSRVVNGQAFEVDKQTLCFSLQEIRDYLGDEFGDNCAATLFEQTEGWAVAVQLATIANKGSKEIVNLFSGKQQYIVSYFAEQILNRSTDLEKRFLLHTAILDKFNVSLAQAITGIDDVSALIYNSKNIQSLIVTLDKEETWFRYHHLFSDLLLKTLKRDSHDWLPSLHAKASLWYEKANKVDAAIKHARLSGDVDRAVSLFLAAGGWELVLYGGVSLMRTLLLNFSAKDFERHPKVRMAYIYFLMKDGNIQEADAQLSKIAISEQDLQAQPQLRRTFYLVSYLLKIYKDDFTNLAALQTIEKLVYEWDRQDALGIAVLRATLTLSAIAIGDLGKANDAAKEGLQDMRKAESILGVNYLYIHLGQIDLHTANLDSAQAFMREAANMAQDNFGIDSRLKTNCDINLQSLNFWREPEQLDAEQMVGLLTNACNTDGWFEIYASGFTSIIESLRLYSRKEQVADVINLITSAVQKRQIPRLAHLSQSLRLSAAFICEDTSKMLQIIDEINSEPLPRKVDDKLVSWLPLCEISFTLGMLKLAGQDIPKAVAQIESCITLCRSINAKMYLIRLLVLKATLDFEAKDAEPAISELLEAAGMAASQSIKTPFLMSQLTLELISGACKQFEGTKEHLLEVTFLNECLQLAKRLNFVQEPSANLSLLSKREMDVINELAKGRSNKEIARNLQMTGNTVKFHLKNIFAKLEVDKRISALNRARSLNLI